MDMLDIEEVGFLDFFLQKSFFLLGFPEKKIHTRTNNPNFFSMKPSGFPGKKMVKKLVELQTFRKRSINILYGGGRNLSGKVQYSWYLVCLYRQKEKSKSGSVLRTAKMKK